MVHIDWHTGKKQLQHHYVNAVASTITFSRQGHAKWRICQGVGGWGCATDSHTEKLSFSNWNRDTCKWISWCSQTHSCLLGTRISDNIEHHHSYDCTIEEGHIVATASSHWCWWEIGLEKWVSLFPWLTLLECLNWSTCVILTFSSHCQCIK